MIDNNWAPFYENIKDQSWPPCLRIEDIFKLPEHIQLEIIKIYLFENRHERLRNDIEHVNLNTANFLYHLDKVKTLIGQENCLMNMQDVIFLYSILVSKRPKNILEIGRFHGWSSSVIYGACQDNNCGHLYSVDIENYTSIEVRQLLQDRVTFIEASSKQLITIDKIKNLKFEVIFIDGDHSYQMMLNDLNQSVTLASDNAWFLLHDADHPPVLSAIDVFVKSRNDLIDCGIYGEKIKLLYKELR